MHVISREMEHYVQFLLFLLSCGLKLEIHASSFLTCDKESSSFINLCGLCVGGPSSLQNLSGLDNCEVCFGSNDCEVCEASLTEDTCQKCSKSPKNCLLQPTIFPAKIDLASNNHRLYLILRGISIPNNLTCAAKDSKSLSSSDEYVLLENDLVNDDVHITIDPSSLTVGSYTIQCSSLTSEGERNLRASLLVIDSRSLRIDSLTPQQVSLNTFFQAELRVSLIAENQGDLLCFLIVNNLVEMIVKSDEVSPGIVKCKPMIARSSSRVFIGVSESLEAIMDNPAALNLVEILTSSIGPIMKKSSFSADLRRITIQFDKNIESSKSCHEAFSAEETQKGFGRGWQCWIKTNEIVIQLGIDADIQPGSRISLIPSNGIRSFGSTEGSNHATPESVIIVDDVANQVIEPLYRILAPQSVCYADRSIGFQSSMLSRSNRRSEMRESFSNNTSVTVVEVQELGGQNLIYNWSVTYIPTKPENLNIVRSQRDMLMIWLSVQLLDRSVKRTTSNKVVLNNSLMLTGVDYTLTVRGGNTLGMLGEEKQIPIRLSDQPQAMEHRSRSVEMNLSACSSGSPLDVLLLSSPATFADAECWVEISLSCCDGILLSEFFRHVDYVWSVKAADGAAVDVAYNRGKQLVIPPNTLQGGNIYNVSCILIHKTHKRAIGSASTSLVTLERGIQTNVNVSAVTVSTMHPLILDASNSIDLDNKPGDLKFKWSCRIIYEISESYTYGDKQCYVPGANKTLLSEKYHEPFRKPLLWLPPGSLPIGRYLFSVEVMKQSHTLRHNDLVNAEVSVVGGSPPLISLPSKSALGNENVPSVFISSEDDVTITGFVSGMKPGCHVLWTVVDKPGCSQLNQSSLHQETFVARVWDKIPHETPVEVTRGLRGDAKYCLRLSAVCPSPKELGVEMSSADIDLITDAPPVVKPLKVEPLEGQALTTLFKFTTEPAYDDLFDCPLRYSFGFRVTEPISSSLASLKFFHTTSQQLSAFTYLPALSLATTKIQTMLRVCDVRHVCHIEEGPEISTSAPTNLTSKQVEILSDSILSFLLTEEYEDAQMAVESSMATLQILDNKSLYELSSQRAEQSINTQLELIEEKLDGSVGSVHAALRFLKVANAALKHGSFTQATLQKLVKFKDRVLSMLSNTPGSSESRMELRIKRQSSKSQQEGEQPWSILQPEMVKALLSISEIAILNLNDSGGALHEKQKLLQNMSFFMDSLCRGLRNPTPIFIGSRVVSFSIQRLNLQVKYKDDLAVPDWRSAKSGGAPINATAVVLLSENVLRVLGRDTVCMGAAFYPMDFLSDVFGKYGTGSFRQSAVYQVKLIQETKGQPRISVTDFHDGLDVKIQSVQIKIPIWGEHISSQLHLECRVWHRGAWNGHYCKLTKFITLINKPAVECLCSVVGYHAIFAVESLWSPDKTSSHPSGQFSSSTSPTTNFPASSTTSQPATIRVATEKTSTTFTPPITEIPAGIPITNTSQNFTFRIQEDYFDTVGTQPDAFISQLKLDILKQVKMPANMIAGIDVNPGSILVTLHLVDTDVRTVNDVLPTLAAVLQEGRLSVSGMDGRHLSVPPQSLQLLQRSSDHSFLPWIVVGCALFSVICICSLLAAAIFVTRKHQQLQFSNDPPTPKTKTRTPTYGRFHLEQTLDGSEATLSRYRSSTNNPLVVSTVGGMASVMGTNAKIPDSYQAANVQYKLQLPQSETRGLSTPRESSNANSSSESGNHSSSSGSNSVGSVQRGIKSLHKQFPFTEDRKPILNCEEKSDDGDEDDSGIVINDIGKISNSMPDSLNVKGVTTPQVPILPGTPTGKDSEPTFT